MSEKPEGEYKEGENPQRILSMFCVGPSMIQSDRRRCCRRPYIAGQSMVAAVM
jgi:hypothetical protein